jgi:hypothetical protein
MLRKIYLFKIFMKPFQGLLLRVSLITKSVALSYIISPLSRFTGSRINYILRMNLGETRKK